MARSYRRDSRGRFSGGGGGGKVTGGSLKARSSAKRSQAKLAAKDPGNKSLSGSLSRRAQRAAATRTGKAASAAKAANRTKLAGGRPAGTVGKAKGAKRQGAPEAKRPGMAQGSGKLTGKGKAPATKLPSASSDQYKYNKAGLLASPQERSRMRGRDRAREKNAALADKQKAGRLKAERRAARIMTSSASQPLSVTRHSPTYNAAERALQRRSKRADNNFGDSARLAREQRTLVAKALKLQNQAAERKAQGKKVTPTMESSFQKLRRQIGKMDRSIATRRKALDVVQQQSRQMTINTRDRRR